MAFFFTYITSQYVPEPQESDSDSEDDEQDGVYSDEGDTQPEDGSSAHKRKNTARDPAQKRRKLDQGVRLFLIIWLDFAPDFGMQNRIGFDEYQSLKAKIDKYFTGGSWYAQSAASTIYILATMLERVDNDFLWYDFVTIT